MPRTCLLIAFHNFRGSSPVWSESGQSRGPNEGGQHALASHREELGGRERLGAQQGSLAYTLSLRVLSLGVEEGKGKQMKSTLCPFYLPALKFYDFPPSMGPCHLSQSLPTATGGSLCSPSSPVTLFTLQGPFLPRVTPRPRLER